MQKPVEMSWSGSFIATVHQVLVPALWIGLGSLLSTSQASATAVRTDATVQSQAVDADRPIAPLNLAAPEFSLPISHDTSVARRSPEIDPCIGARCLVEQQPLRSAPTGQPSPRLPERILIAPHGCTDGCMRAPTTIEHPMPEPILVAPHGCTNGCMSVADLSQHRGPAGMPPVGGLAPTSFALAEAIHANSRSV